MISAMLWGARTWACMVLLWAWGNAVAVAVAREQAGGAAVLDGNGGFPFTTVVDILSQNAEFAGFLRAVQRGGWVPYLNELDDFSLLAPVTGLESGRRLDMQKYVIQGGLIDLAQYAAGVYVVDSRAGPRVVEVRGDGGATVNGVRVAADGLFASVQNAVVLPLAGPMPALPTRDELLRRLQLAGQPVRCAAQLLQLTDGNDANKTLLLPEDGSFESQFDPAELNYLLLAHQLEVDGWYDDQQQLAARLRLRGVHGGAAVAHNATAVSGELVELSPADRGATLYVNGTRASSSNLLFRGGIAHLLDMQGLRSGIEFTADKYLVGLNASAFVEGMYYQKLEHMLRARTSSYTIFVSADSWDHYRDFSRSSLLYHFTDRHLWLEELLSGDRAHQLHDSMFCPGDGFDGRCQRLKLSRAGSDIYINGELRVLNPRPYQVQNTLIYLLERSLEPPRALLSSVSPFLHCTQSLSLLRELGLLDLPSNHHGYTVLLPCFDSWSELELNLDYLQRNASALGQLMGNLIFEGLVYTDDSKERNVSTLHGNTVSVQPHAERANGSVPFGFSNLASDVVLEQGGDIPFDRGVVQPLRVVPNPRAFHVPLSALVDTAGATSFIELLRKVPAFADALGPEAPYSILVPAGLQRHNVGNSAQFLAAHLIPRAATPRLLLCDGLVPTVHGRPLRCRSPAPGVRLLSVAGHQQEVRVLKVGCTDGACVFLLDRPLDTSPARPRLRMAVTGFLLGAFAGLYMGYVLFRRRSSWFRRSSENTPLLQDPPPA
ncbi:AaceriACR029Cp [[Ashbya] aceris (nom. inval.)]|nr:AaceriACR029Cp [[Ashbya] aceris (nom. inval.)]